MHINSRIYDNTASFTDAVFFYSEDKEKLIQLLFYWLYSEYCTKRTGSGNRYPKFYLSAVIEAAVLK